MIKALCGVSYTKADPIKVCSVVEAIRSNPNGSQVEILALAKQIRREHLDATGKVDTANSNPPH